MARILRELLTHKDLARRVAVASELGRIGDKQAYAALYRFSFGVDLVSTVKLYNRRVTEPLFEVYGNSPSTPSVHFRHNGRANVAWCDGHISSEPMGFSRTDQQKSHDIGYIGTDKDNRLYDRN